MASPNCARPSAVCSTDLSPGFYPVETLQDPGEPALRRLERRLDWGDIVSTLEQTKGERWDQFNGRHGDWGRDAALWLGRKRGRYTLSELGQLAGGMDYAAVGQAVSRFGKRLSQSAALRKALAGIERHLSTID